MAIGILVLISLYIDPNTNLLTRILYNTGAYFVDTAVIIAAFALFLGMLNILRVHARKIREQKTQALYSAVLLLALFVVLAVGLPAVPNEPSGPSQPVVQWIFENIQAPIQATLSALLVFFIVTAAYRLLRIRNWESALMLVVALVVLIGQVTVGLLPVVPEVKDWILDVATMAGVRGILLGVALGALLTGLRLLLGVERPYGE
jgi:hypothetical protein